MNVDVQTGRVRTVIWKTRVCRSLSGLAAILRVQAVSATSGSVSRCVSAATPREQPRHVKRRRRRGFNERPRSLFFFTSWSSLSVAVAFDESHSPLTLVFSDRPSWRRTRLHITDRFGARKGGRETEHAVQYTYTSLSLHHRSLSHPSIYLLLTSTFPSATIPWLTPSLSFRRASLSPSLSPSTSLQSLVLVFPFFHRWFHVLTRICDRSRESKGDGRGNDQRTSRNGKESDIIAGKGKIAQKIPCVSIQMRCHL